MRVVALPGLHGTAELLDSFLRAAPPRYQVSALSYPAAAEGSYADLAALVTERLPGGEEFVVVGESFSGPVAVHIAALKPRGLEGLVLCNSFITRPAWKIWRYFPWVTLFRIPGPSFIIRRYMVGSRADRSWVRRIREFVLRSDPYVLAHRMQLVLSVDVRDAFCRVRVPVLDLRGRHDHLIPARARIALKAANSTVVERTVDGPHFLLQVAPGSAWQAIDDFIRDACVA